MRWSLIAGHWSLGFTAILAMVAAVCGGGEQGTYSTPNAKELTVLATRAFPTAGSDELTQLLLRSGDLGDGWTQPSVDQAGLTMGDFYYCDVQVEIPRPDAAVVLQNEAKGIFILIQFASVLPSVEQAQEHVTATRNALLDCDCFVSTDGVRRTEWEIERSDLETIGEESVAFKGQSQIESTQGSLDSEAFFVTARYSKRIVMISATWIGEANVDDMRDILRAADDKLQALSGH